MEVCVKVCIFVWVFDCFNFFGGMWVEGNLLDLEYWFFIGLFFLFVRYGLMIGEFVFLVNGVIVIFCDFKVVVMIGWYWVMAFEKMELLWVNFLFNMFVLLIVQVFLGMVFWEGMNWLEGWGIICLFEVFGYLGFDFYQVLFGLEFVLLKSGLCGFWLWLIYFELIFEKYVGECCGGYQLYLLNFQDFWLWQFGLCIL